MSKCSTTNFNVDASPNILPKAEKSDVRADMKKALQSVAATKKASAVAPVVSSKGAKKFDAAVKHPVLKNLGL